MDNIVTMLKKNKHNKQTAREILMAQLRDYHIKKSPYDTSYITNFDTPCTWWNTCETDPPYLKSLAIKLFSVSPHAASCERVWSICGWIYGKRCVRLSVENLDAI